MAIFKGLAVVAQLAVASAWEEGVQVHSALCTAENGHEPSCSVVAGEDANAQAMATWQDEIMKNGWGRLLVKTPSSEPGIPAFAAGYLEGYLTAERVNQHFNNSFTGAKYNPPPTDLVNFMEKADGWWKKELQSRKEPDSYWKALGFISDQLDGLVAGVNAGQKDRRFTRTDLFMLNSFWDLPDIKKAIFQEERPNFEAMEEDELRFYEVVHGHCSAIVKLLPDGSDLYIGHNTWFEYYHLVRMWKRYEFGSWAPVAMSSYPGMLSSTDDFYQVGHLAVMETTTSVFNNDIYDLIKPEAFPFWIRVMTAHRLATNGPEWMEVFKKHNGGTYNNMWMVVDYSKFTPYQALVEGTFTVGEQLPDYFHYEDQTFTLEYGYWPSYNKARYPETVRLVGQDVKEKTLGPHWGYQFTERAQIFRRDQGTILGDEDLQRILRYNKFQTDPIAKGDPSNQLANRMDLSANPKFRVGFGAIDAKYTSKAHNLKGQAVIVAGPTHDDQPVFAWSADPELAASTPHMGMPDRFDFGWLIVDSDLAATPWVKTPTDAGLASKGAAMVAGAVAVSAAFLALALRRRKSVCDKDAVPDDSYAKMAGNYTPPSKTHLEASPASTACPPSGGGWVTSPGSTV